MVALTHMVLISCVNVRVQGAGVDVWGVPMVIIAEQSSLTYNSAAPVLNAAAHHLRLTFSSRLRLHVWMFGSAPAGEVEDCASVSQYVTSLNNRSCVRIVLLKAAGFY